MIVGAILEESAEVIHRGRAVEIPDTPLERARATADSASPS